MKLRKLRALRGQGNNVQQQPRPTSTSVSTDLEAIRSLFTEKEKELGLAVRKVDELTHQLDDLRNGRVSNHFPPQMVELERLRRELAYRKQLNEQQNNMISQQVKTIDIKVNRSNHLILLWYKIFLSSEESAL